MLSIRVMMEVKDKKVTVFGLAKSGVGAANLLSRLGAHVTVTDMKKEEELADSVRKLDPGIMLALGGHPDSSFLDADLIVISPGVPAESHPVLSAKRKGVRVIGELELAYRVAAERHSFEPIDRMSSGKSRSGIGKGVSFLAITGSNGKSTTTTLLDLMLREGGFRTILGGNIGNALTEELGSMTPGNDGSAHVSHEIPDCIVAEVSSFQLETIEEFRPDIAAILNITHDHMDRYRSLAEYAEAKARIFENQKSGDMLVLNADDPETERLCSAQLSKRKKSEMPEVFFFSRRHEVPGVFCREDKVYCRLPRLERLHLIDIGEIGIQGVHNLENAMAASAMALLAGCPPEAVIRSLKKFRGLEHRLEFVREYRGVRYINDSKGTNVGAVVKSIESFREPLILIAGGRDKAGDFSALRDLVSQKVKTLVLIGEAAQKIKDALGDLTETVVAADLSDAVNISKERAQTGDVVLLSPACASFDMFRDFEDRGRRFKEIVGGLH